MPRQGEMATGSRLTAEEMTQGFMKMARQAREREARGQGHPAPDESPGEHLAAPGLPGPAAEGRVPFMAGQLALDLCEILGEQDNFQYYRYVARLAERAQLLGMYSLSARATALKAKARELTYLKKPNGPINSPPAVFAAWVKSQMNR